VGGKETGFGTVAERMQVEAVGKAAAGMVQGLGLARIVAASCRAYSAAAR
jgi:hypothetical protein